MKQARQRADQLLCERGLAESLERARALVMAGAVLVNGQRVDKAGALVAVDAAVEVTERMPWVSRGAYKLLGALDRVRRNTTVRRVLVVDDEPAVLNLLKRLLEAEPNFEVITAAGGAEALAAVQVDKPDLMILDLMMPDIDGFAVLDNIKGSALTRHIPIIIVTAKELTAEDRVRLQGKTVALFNKGMFTADQLMNNIVTALQLMNGSSVTVVSA